MGKLIKQRMTRQNTAFYLQSDTNFCHFKSQISDLTSDFVYDCNLSIFSVIHTKFEFVQKPTSRMAKYSYSHYSYELDFHKVMIHNDI